MLSSYEAAQLYMKKARNKAKGRPMKSSSWRLFQDGDEYVVTVHGDQLGRFLPDNTFMFTTDGQRAYRTANTLSGTMAANIPFYWKRVGSRKYRVEHRNGMVSPAYVHFAGKNNSPLIYDGLKFDLFTGKCLNYKPDLVRQVDPEKRKVWLAASRAWKAKLKVAARLGVFDSLIVAERKNRTPWIDKPKWGYDEWLDILYKAIKDNDCSTDLLKMFVASEVSWACSETSMEIYNSVEKLLTTYSVELRQRFGVFLEGK